MFSQSGASKSRDHWDMYICSAVNSSEQTQINSTSVNDTKSRGRNWDAGRVEGENWDSGLVHTYRDIYQNCIWPLIQVTRTSQSPQSTMQVFGREPIRRLAAVHPAGNSFFTSFWLADTALGLRLYRHLMLWHAPLLLLLLLFPKFLFHVHVWDLYFSRGKQR